MAGRRPGIWLEARKVVGMAERRGQFRPEPGVKFWTCDRDL